MVHLRNLSPLLVVEVATHSEFNMLCCYSFGILISASNARACCPLLCIILRLELALWRAYPTRLLESQNNHTHLYHAPWQSQLRQCPEFHITLCSGGDIDVSTSLSAISFIQHRLHKRSMLATNQPFNYAGLSYHQVRDISTHLLLRRHYYLFSVMVTNSMHIHTRWLLLLFQL